MNKRNVLEGIGAALLLLLPYYAKLLLPSHLEIFHLHLPISNVIGGLLVDLFIYSVVLTGFLIGIDRLPSRSREILSTLFAAAVFWSSVDFAFEVLVHLLYRVGYWARIWGKSAILVIFIAGILAWVCPRVIRPPVEAIRAMVAAFAFTGLWIVPQLFYIGLAHPAEDKVSLLRPVSPKTSISNHRIIWLLFDELSYDQTFDHRSPGIQLPNLDSLRAESTSFTSLTPAGFYTDRIIPSLFSGQGIYEIRSTVNGELQYRQQPHAPWIAYDPNATVFALARGNGWRTGIEGWFNPYCRMFGSLVDTCSWEANLTPIEEYGASQEKSILSNAALMPNRLIAPLRQISTSEERQMQIYRNTMDHAQALIEDDQTRFVFVHISVPHGPGIFDRKHHVFRSGGTYLDRLVMADDTLGTLMAEIEGTASASKTTVIVSSDHSWRISLSRNSDSWTEEEERACNGKFDDRPVLLVHFPDRAAGRDISTKLPEMLEHDMIANMLLEKINSSDDLNRFISQLTR